MVHFMGNKRKYSGGCLCEKTRYSVTGMPLIVTICHCKYCQKATGSAFAIEPIFERQHLLVTFGVAKVYEHTSKGSGSAFSTSFCENCGTKLFITFERLPDQVAVYGGTFDDPDWFEISSNNTQHIFLDEARKGTLVPAGFKTFGQHCLNSEGSMIDSTVFQEIATVN